MRNHWVVLGELDPELNERIKEGREYMLTDDDTLPRKTRELINVAMACVIRFEPAVLAHAKLARQYGASNKEILGAVEQAYTMGGNPAMRTGLVLLDEFLHEDDD